MVVYGAPRPWATTKCWFGTRRRRIRTVNRWVIGAIVSCLVLISSGGSLAGGQVAATAGSRVGADFNGDGFADLAIGVPGEDVGAIADAGAVNVIYGSPSGLTASRNQRFGQNTSGIGDSSEAGDAFGSALAGADFNGDGFDDLTIGVPGEDVGTIADAGAVNVIYGSAGGLTAARNQFWTRDSAGIQGTAGSLGELGSSLTAGDLGRTFHADLAVGGSGGGTGGVLVIYGSSTGLASPGNQLWTPSSLGIPPGAEEPQGFGVAVAAADFGRGAPADLAVGLPGHDVGACTSPADCMFDAGAVSIIYGSATGLTAAGNQLWTQDSAGIQGTAGQADNFGRALAGADFGRGGQADLAIGVPSLDSAGEVSVLYGSATGLAAPGNQLWTQDTPGMLDTGEVTDGFGFALAAGNFGKGSQADLAVGVPFEDVRTIEDAGAVNVIYGSAGGLTAAGNQFWNQDSSGIEGAAEGADRFGSAITGPNLGRSAEADLAVGVPLEDVGTVFDAGRVNVIYGSATGLSASGDQVWHQNSSGIEGSVERSDRLGWAVGTGGPSLRLDQF
jgi:hypothetical protein